MSAPELKTVQFDPSKYRLVPVEPSEAMLLDLALLKEWFPHDPEGTNDEAEHAHEGFTTMLANLPEPPAEDVVDMTAMVAKAKDWEENAKALLDSYPKSIRSRYKGLAENLLESMCLTFIDLRDQVLGRK